jgi:hypothetical protein
MIRLAIRLHLVKSKSRDDAVEKSDKMVVEMTLAIMFCQSESIIMPFGETIFFWLVKSIIASSPSWSSSSSP